MAYLDRTWTWAEWNDRGRRAAGGLRDLGVGRGDVVAFLDKNHPDCVEISYAAASLGAANARLGPSVETTTCAPATASSTDAGSVTSLGRRGPGSPSCLGCSRAARVDGDGVAAVEQVGDGELSDGAGGTEGGDVHARQNASGPEPAQCDDRGQDEDDRVDRDGLGLLAAEVQPRGEHHHDAEPRGPRFSTDLAQHRHRLARR